MADRLRRIPQFSLKGMFVIVALAAVVTEFAILARRQKRDQDLQWIADHGGTFFEGPGTMRDMGTRLSVADVVAQGGRNVTAVQLEWLTDDETMARLLRIPTLRRVDLTMTGVTDIGLSRLLHGLPALEGVNARFCSIGSDGLNGIRNATGLKHLSLSVTGVNDRGVMQLSGLQNLVFLDLTNTAVSDGAIASICKMHRLRTLGLAGTRVTDAGASKLVDLKELRDLDLRDTDVTPDCADRLREAMPHCITLHSVKAILQ